MNKPLKSFEDWLFEQEPGFFDTPKAALAWFRMLVGQSCHNGDCTGVPVTCCLCLAEDLLRQYREYDLQDVKKEEK